MSWHAKSLHVVDGRMLHLHGYKMVDLSVTLSPMSFWQAVTMLYISISEHFPAYPAALTTRAGTEATFSQRASMHSQLANLGSKILTMIPIGTNLLGKAISTTSFTTFFRYESLNLLLAPLTSL